MILHITFADGSNPWVSLPADRHTIAKQWRQWEKNHPNNARPEAMLNGWKCQPGFVHGYYVFRELDRYPYLETNYYKHLGHALAALERLGGGTK